MPDVPEPYELKDDEPPRSVSFPGKKRSRIRKHHRDPFLIRLMDWDPFPPIMISAVIAWIGLGLGSRHWPWMSFVLTAVGFFVVVLGQVYQFALIFRDDTTHGIFSMLSGWYRAFYLQANQELTWKPIVISICGLMMILTGTFGWLSHRTTEYVGALP